MLTTRIVLLSACLGLLAACASIPARQSEKQSENKSARQAPQARETPIPLKPSKENKGERCKGMYYTDVGGDTDYNPFCYKLQIKLLKATQEGNLDVMREALSEGAHPDGSVYDSYPPLFQAAAKGRIDALLLLLDNGSNINQEQDFQQTALRFAIANNQIEAVKVLIERGADVCYKSFEGTYEDDARALGYTQIAELLKAARATNCK